jgi:Family of unknown function (DUF5654)
MNDDQQRQEAERRRRFGVPNGVDPRKVMDAAAVEKLLKAQAVARAEAQAATTVVIATVVSLVTSAFSFIAAFAWNTAIQDLLSSSVGDTFFGFKVNATGKAFIYAILVTLIAIVVTLLVNRFAGNLAKKSAIAAASMSN